MEVSQGQETNHNTNRVLDEQQSQYKGATCNGTGPLTCSDNFMLISRRSGAKYHPSVQVNDRRCTEQSSTGGATPERGGGGGQVAHVAGQTGTSPRKKVSDFLGLPLPRAHLFLKEIYRDHLHHNYWTHVDGGVSGNAL